MLEFHRLQFIKLDFSDGNYVIAVDVPRLRCHKEEELVVSDESRPFFSLAARGS